ncbi:MAG: hypothetical protein ABSH10_02750 [Phycisphaerae bacterium]|jgi:hypothetical protein
MNAVGDPAGTGLGGTWRSTAWRNRHFLIAAAILAITWLGWDWAIAQLKWVTRKDPVPWTPAVKVDADCRLISFPDRLGPYVLVGDGEFEKELDGRPDGDVVLRQDVLDTLKINTSLDKDRLASRSSNWYMVRIYRDTRVESPSSPFRYWRLELYYYTGRLYQVPHVPDRCLVAGGATMLPAAAKRLEMNAPGASAPWDHAAFNRVGYEMTDRTGLDVRRYVQYYAFSLNGQPEVSWEKVRLELTKPWVRHCYFAKIQLAPTGPVSDFAEADRSVNEFLDMFMPAVVATWPMPSVVDKLNASSPSAP